MIPTQRAHRIVAALAVPAFFLTAACGSESGDDEGNGDGPVATVSGEPGEQPEIEIDADASVAEETVVEVLREGEGAEVAEGDYLRMDVVATAVAQEAELVNTWRTTEGEPTEQSEDGAKPQVIAQANVESSLPQTVTEPLVGQQVGSRVQVEGQAGELLGAAAQQVGLQEDDGVVWVFDIVAAASVDPAGSVEGEQAETEDGLPTVEMADEGPQITVPEGEDPPAELQEQLLVEGDGPEVANGQALVVQYTGVTWADGEVFDSSWERESASAFQIGTGSVVPGWDQGLVGKHVGDRVLLVIPPDMAYGDQENGGIPAGSTLVFVVDIIGAA
ncbi:FKBP-type peptidyl-prolyl cis-trans isomerase [Streptomyces sp. 3MP-14]|uniref:peptidylprolyl isomerase n=1 Tax=Streptomyces mimosae TaxID=2586635 RepID=A0A5N6A165_9ACTN|nr:MULTISPECIES: FKBP-type peptidyl-prolyl cis-trans isomerase [Streptomyces]KAB8162494.1 FKBP-type peptidyl-prolyl cis-trans isomerase [Streptomyces mimosae]KAB8174320.1 FKBP-type peptidyl-prolyl cis-trans isomerase [Streptomyces sp. 3MP-14]